MTYTPQACQADPKMCARTSVILCSPYAGDRERNDAYLRRCMADSLLRGEAPLASHALWTQFLDDAVHDQRETGLECEREWMNSLRRSSAQMIDPRGKLVAYVDLGVSSGMARAIHHADLIGLPVERREIGAQVAGERAK